MDITNIFSQATDQLEAAANIKAQEVLEVESRTKDLTQFLIHINNKTKDEKLDLTQDPVAIQLIEKIKGHSPEIFQDEKLEWVKKDLDLLKENIRHLQKTYDIDVSSLQKHLQHNFDMYKTILDNMRRTHERLNKMYEDMAKVGKS